METKTFLRVKKVFPKDIVKQFTKENEQSGVLNNYFFFDEYNNLKKMNTCSKFVEVLKGGQQMLKLLLPGQTCEEEKLVKLFLETTNAMYVANRMDIGKEIFYAVKPKSFTLQMINDHYEFIEYLAAESTFFRIEQ